MLFTIKTFVTLLFFVGLVLCRYPRPSYDDSDLCLIQLDELNQRFADYCEDIFFDVRNITAFAANVTIFDGEFRALRETVECVAARKNSYSNYFHFFREHGHISDNCTLALAGALRYTPPPWSVRIKLSLLDLSAFTVEVSQKFVDVLGGYWSSLRFYDFFVVFMSVVNPWFPVAYLFTSNISIALIAPLLAFNGFSVHYLWLYTLLNFFLPGFSIGASLVFAVRAYYLYRRRRLESFAQVSYTFLYFILLGAYVEIAFRFYHIFPTLVYGGFFGFLVLSTLLVWSRETIVVEYTVVKWKNGESSLKTKPRQIVVETDFPFTLLRWLNKYRLWLIGVPWSSVENVMKGYFGDQPIERVAVPQQRHVTFSEQSDQQQRRPGLGLPGAPSASNGTLDGRVGGVKTPFNYKYPDSNWEAKGKTKRGRGAVRAKAQQPVTFKRVKSAFWMSDPDVDIEYIREYDGDDWRHVEQADWDLLDGYLEIVKSDGSREYIYYENIEEMEQQTLESDVIVSPGASIPCLYQIVTKRKVEAALAPSTLRAINECETAALKQIAEVRSLVQLLLEAEANRAVAASIRDKQIDDFINCHIYANGLKATFEANGTVNALPAQPAPAFTNPVAAFLPDGCFHHPSCTVSKTTLTPCRTDCKSSTCVHNSKCKHVIPEAKPRDDNRKGKKGKQPAKAVERTMDSAVRANPLVEYPETLMASVVTVEGSAYTGYGVYTDRGVITEKHILYEKDTSKIGSFKIHPFYSPGVFYKSPDNPADVISYFNGDTSSELILIKARLVGGVPLPVKNFYPFVGESARGAIICPSGSAVGNITKRTGSVNELEIDVGTRVGMCGCPYATGGHIVGFHAFGNNNGVNNSGIAVTIAHKEWLAAQPKN